MYIFDSFIGPGRPLSWALHFWPVLASSLFAALAATWLCKKVAIKFNIVDKPDNLVKTHKEPVAYLGGVGILAGIIVGILTAVYMLKNEVAFASVMTKLFGILLGAVIACFVGVIDDIFNLKPGQKILGQLLAASILILVGVVPSFQFLQMFGINLSEMTDYVMASAVVIIFVLGATNSLNLLDGLDGLCAGVTAIMAVALLILSIHLGTWATYGQANEGDPIRIVLCLSLLGGVCGFLPFNRHPAKIFMGDAGSMLLGFMIATLMIMFGRRIPRWWLASIVVFGLPILDTATAFIRRFLAKRPIFVSDRGHIYDQMIDRGITLRKTVAICYLLTGMYALIGLAMSQIKTRYAVVVYCLVFIISGLVIWYKGFLRMEGVRGAVPQKSKADTKK